MLERLQYNLTNNQFVRNYKRMWPLTKPFWPAALLNDYTTDVLGAAAYRWQMMARDFWMQNWKGF